MQRRKSSVPNRRGSGFQKPPTDRPQKLAEIELLRARVQELEQTLEAIRGGEVDALVVGDGDGVQVYTLQGAEVPYRVMVESIREGAATLDAQGTVLYSNGRLADLLSVPLERLIGTTLQDHMPRQEWPKLRELLGKGRQHSVTCELAIGEITGTRRVLRISFSPFRGPGLELVCAIASEVTELVEANEAQRESEHKLQILSGRLMKLQDEERRHISRDLHDVSGQNLAALNLALGQLEGIAGLHAIPNAQSLLQQSRQLAEQVSQEIRTLSYVLHPPLLEEVGLASAVRWYANGFGQRTGIRVQTDITTNMVRLSQDAEIALFRVLQEALTNVHRYSESGTVQLRLGVDQGAVQLEIEDQGKGISEAVLRGRATSAALGVGIQGMQERMRQLSGKLEITSGLGQGTKVVATVPLSGHTSEMEPIAEDPADTEHAGAGKNGSSRRVLIADDHAMLRQGVRRVLQQTKDWVVCGEASNGKEAVEKAVALHPDLVILDLSMPVLNGLDALRQIRKKSPDTKVLVFTVNNSEHVVREISAAGADGYLCKSNAAEDLLDTLKTLFADESSLRASAAQS